MLLTQFYWMLLTREYWITTLFKMYMVIILTIVFESCAFKTIHDHLLNVQTVETITKIKKVIHQQHLPQGMFRYEYLIFPICLE